MLTVTRANGVATVTLDRPEVRNALDAELIAAIRDRFTTLAADDAVRVVERLLLDDLDARPAGRLLRQGGRHGSLQC